MVGCAEHACGQFRPQIANHVVGPPSVGNLVELVACLVELPFVHESLSHCGLVGKGLVLSIKECIFQQTSTFRKISTFQDFTF